MSRELVESILAGDFVSANDLFEEKLSIIREQKLYEEKRRIAALHEMNYRTRYQELKAAGAPRASDVWNDDGQPKLQSSTDKVIKKTPKKLAEPGTVIPRSLSIGDRYEKALSRAKDLEARGSSGKVSAVKKAYRPYRAAKALTTGVKKGIGFWGNAVRAGMSGPLEE